MGIKQVAKLSSRSFNFVRRHVGSHPCVEPFVRKGYRHKLQQYQPQLPKLDPFYQEVVRGLDREGVFMTSLDELNLPLSDALLSGGQKLASRLARRSPQKSSNSFICPQPQEILDFPSVFFWGLQKQISNLVEAYLGLPVAYHGAYLKRDFADNVQKHHRLWHFDLEDYRSVKVIVYLEDVFEGQGPFQYIPKTFFPSVDRPKEKYALGRYSDETLLKDWKSLPAKSCYGPKGTVIFVDTANTLHRGQVPVKSDRYAIFFDYTSKYPKRPYYCKSSLPSQQLQSITRDLDSVSKSVVFWRDRSSQETALPRKMGVRQKQLSLLPA